MSKINIEFVHPDQFSGLVKESKIVNVASTIYVVTDEASVKSISLSAIKAKHVDGMLKYMVSKNHRLIQTGLVSESGDFEAEDDITSVVVEALTELDNSSNWKEAYPEECESLLKYFKEKPSVAAGDPIEDLSDEGEPSTNLVEAKKEQADLEMAKRVAEKVGKDDHKWMAEFDKTPVGRAALILQEAKKSHTPPAFGAVVTYKQVQDALTKLSEMDDGPGLTGMLAQFKSVLSLADLTTIEKLDVAFEAARVKFRQSAIAKAENTQTVTVGALREILQDFQSLVREDIATMSDHVVATVKKEMTDVQRNFKAFSIEAPKQALMLQDGSTGNRKAAQNYIRLICSFRGKTEKDVNTALSNLGQELTLEGLVANPSEITQERIGVIHQSVLSNRSNPSVIYNALYEDALAEVSRRA